MKPNSTFSDKTPFVPMGNNEAFLTVEELAAFLKVPKSWIYAHTRRGAKLLIPHMKMGKYLRFFEPDVLAFLQDQNGKRNA